MKPIFPLLTIGMFALGFSLSLAEENRERREVRPDFQAQVQELRQEIEKHIRAGHREEAENLERRLRELMGQRGHGRPEPGEAHRGPAGKGMEQKIHHLHAAAENLEQAGFHEEAEELHHRAEKIEQEMQAARERERMNPGAVIDALHREIAELHEIVHDLREHVKNLERELDEVREQVGKEKKRDQ